LFARLPGELLSLAVQSATGNMGQVIVRDLEDHVIERHRERALPFVTADHPPAQAIVNSWGSSFDRLTTAGG
jgi:hypothetical protein